MSKQSLKPRDFFYIHNWLVLRWKSTRLPLTSARDTSYQWSIFELPWKNSIYQKADRTSSNLTFHLLQVATRASTHANSLKSFPTNPHTYMQFRGKKKNPNISFFVCFACSLLWKVWTMLQMPSAANMHHTYVQTQKLNSKQHFKENCSTCFKAPVPQCTGTLAQ